ncbi:lysozyme family protein [Streptomyces phaeochromogenes]|uniref:hypothetical protein n=1 Tax=Streptomyces phaeochromogenes TaxID=1923 RepID=UPI0036BE98DE
MANRYLDLEQALAHKSATAPEEPDTQPPAAASFPAAMSRQPLPGRTSAPVRRGRSATLAGSFSAYPFRGPAPFSAAASAPPGLPGDVVARTRRFEASIPHLYLDTVGAVTVGVGHMLPSADAAAAVDLLRNSDGKPATEAEKRADFTSVAQRVKGKPASFYKQYTQLHLAPATIEAILRDDVDRVRTGLRSRLPDWDTYPVAVQEALLDMAFNLGENGLFTKFPHFITAVRAKNWRTAAAQSKRTERPAPNGIPKNRNDEIRVLLESAAP